ncbi:excinuclease ABC subunit C [Algibacter marinivivus]|uniref:Excinuclease ABC subunit C n=1 Tax=Algibacter marinivivus TaxID=2100723 RepID=A0A2U2X6N4_9FLAO|nr:GIY-YIG nuclease family protein [Algibacter marinivivus]PWH83467.1 excinuclease ABC subunit C [Algibacter marinivivus]
MSYYVYILYSSKLNKYYVGSSEDVNIRLDKHLQSHKGFTGKAKDWVLKYTETYDSKSESIRREFQIKKWKSRKMIESLIEKSDSSG